VALALTLRPEKDLAQNVALGGRGEAERRETHGWGIT